MQSFFQGQGAGSYRRIRGAANAEKLGGMTAGSAVFDRVACVFDTRSLNKPTSSVQPAVAGKRKLSGWRQKQVIYVRLARLGCAACGFQTRAVAGFNQCAASAQPTVQALLFFTSAVMYSRSDTTPRSGFSGRSQ